MGDRNTVRYWRETTKSQFFEVWAEPSYNKMEQIEIVGGEIRVMTEEESEDFIYAGIDDDE